LARGKLRKFDHIRTLPNVLENNLISPDPLVLSNCWETSIFRDRQDLTLELGCGWGEYALNLGKRHPGRDFIGIDIKGSRLWHGAVRSLEEGLSNVFFIRMQISHLAYFFPDKSVSEIWLTFPDPHKDSPVRSDRRRLTSPRFLSIYKKILKEGGLVHLKTDDSFLYNYTMDTVRREGGMILRNTDNLYSSALSGDATEIQTIYEKRYLLQNKSIRYVMFSL
jgi:tRNA (guanine-N7-)-methyltransferase